MNVLKNKKILYGAIAILLVATSLFFAIYNAVGSTFNYTKKNLDRFVTISDAAYLSVALSALEKGEFTEKGIKEALAATLKAVADTKATAKTEGKVGAFDLLNVNYWATYTDGEGNVKIAFNQMDPAKTVQLQVNSADELAKILGDALADLNLDDYAYNTVKEGYVGAGDVAFVTYVKAGGAEVKNQQIPVGTVSEEFPEAFHTAIKNNLIGTEIKTVEGFDSIKVNWVARAELAKDTETADNNKIVAGDVVFATIKTKNSEGKDVSFFLRIDGGVQSFLFTSASNVASAAQSVIVEAVFGANVGDAGKKIQYFVTADTTPVAGKDYYTKTENSYTKAEDLTAFAEGVTYYESLGQEYTYTIEDVVRAGATLEGGLVAMDAITYTYEDDATTKADDGTELKGKEVTFHVVPVSFVEVPYDAKTIAALKDEQVDSIFGASSAASVFGSLKDYTEKYNEAVEHLEAELKKADVDYEETLAAYLAAVKEFCETDDENAEAKEVKKLHKKLNKLLKKGDLDKEKRETHISDVETNYTYVALYVKSYVKSFEEDKTVTEESVFADVTAYVEKVAKTRPELIAEEALAIADLLAAYEKAEKTFDDAIVASHDEKVKAYFDAMKAYVADNSDANKTAKETALEAVLATATDKREANKKNATAAETAYKAYYDAVKKYIEENDTEAVLADVLANVNDYLTGKIAQPMWDSAREAKEEELYNDYYNDVAKAIWDSIYETAEVKLPRRAVRLAYKEAYKAVQYKYYTATSTTIDKTKYPTFKKYLLGTYGEDYKDDLKKEAETYVKEQLVVFYVAEKIEAIPEKNKDFEESYMFYLYNSTSYMMYVQYASMIESFGRTADMMYEQLRVTYAFDSMMQTLLGEDAPEGVTYKATLDAYRDELRAEDFSAN
ncbi:MAG: hypothetical protein J6R40_03585 [Clostridia bacterium]|nr:hypothetical protein [Clostridia bacterium]